jgi:hypothetical protein
MKAIVFYYSGHLNTAIIAEEIAKKFEGEIFPVEDKRLAAIGSSGSGGSVEDSAGSSPQNSAFPNFTLFFFGTPMIDGKIPEAMKSFIGNLNMWDKDAVLFLASDGEVENKAFYSLKKLIQKRNGNVRQEFFVNCKGLDDAGVREAAAKRISELRV